MATIPSASVGRASVRSLSMAAKLGSDSERAAPLRALVVVGTRPEMVKLAPVAERLRVMGASVCVVATGQHVDPRLAGGIMDEVGLRPDVVWDLAGDEPGRVGALLERSLRLMATVAPDVVIVQGDTWTVPLAALAARRHGVAVAHVEAGLRSDNLRSQEEINRRLMATLATVHLAPTDRAARNLRAEGVVDADVHVVGNTGCDALRTSSVRRVAVADRDHVVVTAHRATNVDDPERLAELVAIVVRLADEVGPVVFPVHPRTAARLDEHGLHRQLRHDGVTLLPPVPHRSMLRLIARSRLVVTDSGGLQEETSWFGVPVVVLRATTPRGEGVELGQAALCGVDQERVLGAARALTQPAALDRIDRQACPYGDGHAAQRIVDLLLLAHERGGLSIDEPVLPSARGAAPSVGPAGPLVARAGARA